MSNGIMLIAYLLIGILFVQFFVMPFTVREMSSAGRSLTNLQYWTLFTFAVVGWPVIGVILVLTNNLVQTWLSEPVLTVNVSGLGVV